MVVSTTKIRGRCTKKLFDRTFIIDKSRCWSMGLGGILATVGSHSHTRFCVLASITSLKVFLMQASVGIRLYFKNFCLSVLVAIHDIYNNICIDRFLVIPMMMKENRETVHEVGGVSGRRPLNTNQGYLLKDFSFRYS